MKNIISKLTSLLVREEIKPLQDRNGIKYEVNSKTPFTGKLKSLLPPGMEYIHGLYWKEETHWRDGKKDGIQTWWYKNGQKYSEESYKEGNFEGYIMWYKNGQRSRQVSYKEGIFETTWYENGQKWYEEQAWDKEDEGENGYRTEWYDNGQKMSHVENGLMTEWDRLSGYKEGESHWKDGQKDGVEIRWDCGYFTGERWMSWKKNFKNGEEDGLYTVWYKNGQREYQANFKDGKEEGAMTEWHENGQKKSEGSCKNGELDGLMTVWDQNGEIEGVRAYKNGNEVVK